MRPPNSLEREGQYRALGRLLAPLWLGLLPLTLAFGLAFKAPWAFYPIAALSALLWVAGWACLAVLVPVAWRKAAWPLLLSTAFVGAALAYAGAAVGQVLWGLNPDQDNFRTMLDFLPGAAKSIGLKAWQLGLLITVLWAGVGTWLWRRHAQAALGHPAWARWMNAVLLLGLFGNLFAAWDGGRHHQARWIPTLAWHWEPLLSTWHLEQQQGFQDTPARRAAAEQDARALADYRPAAAPLRKHIILIVIDALRPDRLPHYGSKRMTTPFLSGLARSPHWAQVQRAYSQAPESIAGLGALLHPRWPKSLAPWGFGVPRALKLNGFKTHFMLNGTHHWFGLKEFYQPDPDSFYSGDGQHVSLMNEDRMVLRALSGLPRADGGRHFVMLHLMSVHEVGELDPARQRWQPTAPWGVGEPPRPGMTDAEWAEGLSNEYDNRVLQADEYLRVAWTILQAKGYLRDAVVAITSDHGQGMGEHGHWGHTRTLHEEIVRVPLFFWSDRPMRVQAPGLAALIDVGPTLMAEAGLPLPSSWEGRPLRPGSRPRRLVAMADQMFEPAWSAFIWDSPWGRIKYHRQRHRDGRLGPEQLYQLDQDPGEQRNALDGCPAPLREALARLDGLYLDPVQWVPSPSH